MYKVVEFKKRGQNGVVEVESVPGEWVKEGVCMWPTFKGKALETALKLRVAPGPDWIPLEIKLLCTTDSYEEGRRKAREAEKMSDVQSEAEEQGVKRRRKMQRRRIQEDSDTGSEEEAGRTMQPDGLSAAPLISQPTYTTLEPRQGQFTIPARPWLPSPSPQEDIPRSPQLHHGEMGSHIGHTRPPPRVPASLIQEILTKLEMVLEQQTLILRLIQPSQQNAAEYAMEDGLLPLMDQQGLQRLETDLLEAEFKVKLINHLSLIGGCNLKDALLSENSNVINSH
ncbi:hypothetical protein UPYG_G00079520 [Umbra pygmaea]|uniref:Uncharacterized protein n=1 Tax=Umbra pygmaea TaxID=75934 RepID=A0ABD0XGU5_UMBPY